MFGAQTLCQEAGLSAAGIKAELVTRLLDHQQAAPPAAGNALGPTPSADAAPTGGALAPPVPASVNDAAAAADPALHATAAAAVAVPTEAERRAAIEAELAKRKARAERFGPIPGGEEAGAETAKKLERAERFGTGPDAGTDLGALDSALADGKGRRGGAGQGRKGQPKASGGKPAPAAAAVAAPPKEKTAADLEWEEKKRKRMERFGASGEDPSAKKQKA